MSKTGLIYLGALLAVGAMGLGAGCSDGGGTGGAGGTGGTGGTGGSSSSSSGAVAATCDGYCASIATNCSGATKQYTDDATCKAVCAAYQAGKVGDMSGNSLECRAYHAGAAKDDAMLHCPHAGPGGGDIDPTDAAGGSCGEACDSFCDIALAVCGPTSINKQYNDKPTCLADCKTFKPSTTAYDTTDLTKNDFNCRLYHVNAAATDPGTHCGHIVSGSTICAQ